MYTADECYRWHPDPAGGQSMHKRVKLDMTTTSCPHLETTEIRPPTASQHVYKDECCHCFYSQDSERGIDVCLSCFQSGCIAPNREHALGHFRLFPSHTIVLNIRRREKSQNAQSSDASTAITKLAIAAETDTDKYEYHKQLRCQACQIDLQSAPKIVMDTVEAVMKALSSSQQSEVKAWEQEMIACEHTLTLQQEPSRALENQNLATCSKCELSENLWLCLVCGTLSCGRAQFGGGGGNGHGLQHVDSTGHSLAVKLGSITPEGTADVYCYACDEERIDPMLQEHLAHWGIRLADRTKTERSLQEMQIEQNMKWEFSMTSEDGKEMSPLFGPAFTGMTNIGNSCYLASVMQSLFSLPAFERRFLQPFAADPRKVVAEPAEDLETQMRKIADGLLSGDFSVPRESDTDNSQYQVGIAPAMIKSLLGRGHAEFSTMRQQDAFEFLLFLVEKLNKLGDIEGLANPTRSFQFEVEQRTQCLSCRRVAYKTTVQDNISVLVPARKFNSSDVEDGSRYEDVSVEELLDDFTAVETVQYKCAACEGGAGAIKQTLFKTLPETLVLNPGRFSLENWVPMKLEIPVIVPEDGFSLDHYFTKGQQEDEELLPEDAPKPDQALTLNEADVEQLMAMGFPRVRAEKALYNTRAGAEVAMEWLFAHMEDADIDEPYVPMSTTSEHGNTASPDTGIVAALTDMGFPEPRCQKAALATNNTSTEAAMDWLMQHMDDPDIDDPLPANASSIDTRPSIDSHPGTEERGARYRTKAMACHKGSSIHAGHYVAFVKRKVDDKEDWVLYNDEKVLRGVDSVEASKTAYVYFFERST